MASASLSGVAPPFRFGAVEIRPATREVVGPTGLAVIEPKVMQVLMLLIAAKGEVVTRDRLVDECWAGRAVSEDAISRVIQRLRRLGETLGARDFAIKTVHKLGYRLLVPDMADDVRPTHPQQPPERHQPDASAVGAIGRRSSLAALGVVIATGAGGSWLWRRDTDAGRAGALIAMSEQALRSGSLDAPAQAMGMLEQASRVEAGSALVWGRLALTRTLVAESSPPSLAAAAVIGVQDAARRAREIDNAQIDARAALALLPPYYGDWHAAEARMDAVLARAPDHLPTRDARDFMLSAVGRGREGSRDRVRMAAEDPLHAGYQTMLVYAHWTLGDLEQADRAADRALQLWPRNEAAWFARFNTLALAGRPTRALALLADADARPELPPWLVETLRAVGVGLGKRRREDVRAAASRLVAEVTLSPGRAISAVTLLAGLGEVDDAFRVADAYLLEEGPLMASVRWRRGQNAARDEHRRKTNMLFLPSSAPMRADPRFAMLMERTGLAHYWREARVRPDHLA